MQYRLNIFSSPFAFGVVAVAAVVIASVVAVVTASVDVVVLPKK